MNRIETKLAELGPGEEAKSFVLENIVEYVDSWDAMIHDLAKQFSNSIVDYDDMYQESILKVIEVLPKCDTERCKRISNYLVTCIAKKIRSMSYENSFSMHVPSGSMRIINKLSQQRMKGTDELLMNVESGFIDAVTKIDIKEALETYDTEGILKDYYYKGMKQKEISQDRGISISAVSRKIKRVLDQLKRCFNE